MKKPAVRGALFAVAGFAAALAIRSVFLARLTEGYDITSWKIAVEILERGGHLYRETSRYNYSPLWAGILVVLDRIGRPLSLSLERMVSLFLLAVDVATALLLRTLAIEKGWSPRRALAASLVFFANPVSVIVSSYLGTFDNLSILFLLLALRWAARRPASAVAVTGSLSLSLLAKHVTWFHPIVFAQPRGGRARFSWITAICPYLVFLASFLPFWREWDAIRAHVFGYRSLDEPYGLEPLRFVPWLPRETTTILMVLAALATVALCRNVETGRASLLLFLVLLLFAPGICPYYFVWPIALGALYPSAGYAVYTAVVTAFLVHSPDGLGVELPHLPGWSGPWWALVFWLLWEIRSLSRERLVRRETPAAVAAPGAGDQRER